MHSLTNVWGLQPPDKIASPLAHAAAEIWEGVANRYWRLPVYFVPTCVMKGEEADEEEAQEEAGPAAQQEGSTQRAAAAAAPEGGAAAAAGGGASA